MCGVQKYTVNVTIPGLKSYLLIFVGVLYVEKHADHPYASDEREKTKISTHGAQKATEWDTHEHDTISLTIPCA